MSAPRPLVLVVEDDPGVATLQRRRLERAGFDVVSASTAAEALAVLHDRHVNLVVLDYRLSDESTGFDLHRRMKAEGFETPVIMVSGETDEQTALVAMRTGVRDFIVKSVDYLEYLPEAARAVAAQAEAGIPLHGADGTAQVLLVEDDPGAATLQQRALERAGYRVMLARTAEEALEIVRQHDVTLAILDLRLQGPVSGLELYQQVRAEGRQIPAIVVTAFGDEQAVIQALRAGVRDFLPKAGEYLDHLPHAADRVLEQTRIQRKLVESEVRLASIVGTATDAILMCDEQTRVVVFNRAAERMFGCAAATAIGSPMWRFLPGFHPPDAAPGSDRPPAADVPPPIAIDAVRTDGSRFPVELSLASVMVHDRVFSTVIARDITERQRAETALREADRRKDEFLGMLAHELRNPLAAIMSASAVLDQMLEDARAGRIVAVVKRQSAALAHMIDDLLDVSRITLGKVKLALEPLALGPVVARAVDTATPFIDKRGHTLTVDVEEASISLNADPTRLEQVLVNLLTNAAKFTDPGGHIWLSVQRDADTTVIRVRDTGVGMAPETLPHIFDLFVQADKSLDRSQGGLGVGLALVRQLVALHGGTVTAHSAGPGRGSEFVVRLPIIREAPAEPLPAPATPEARRMRVLVADDQADMADCLAMLIQGFGHEVRAVYAGAQAIAAARNEPPDVMFVDIGMPDIDGYDVARKVRQDPRLAAIRLVALTGYSRADDRARALQAGFDLHLAKPLSEQTLRTVLVDLGRREASR